MSEQKTMTPQINESYIAALETATDVISEEKFRLSGIYHKTLEDATKNARIEKRRTGLSKLMHGERYYFTDLDKLDRELEEKVKELDEKYFPVHVKSSLERIQKYSLTTSAIKKIPIDIVYIQDEVDTFLDYFFPTPVNRIYGKKSWEEIVPIEEEFDFFGLMRSKRSVPFKKSGTEKIDALMENKEIMETLLKREHIESFIKKINETSSEFTKDLRQASEDLSFLTANKEPKELDHHLKMDIELYNCALSTLNDKDYSIKTGLSAITLNTSLSKLKPRIERYGILISEDAREVLNIPSEKLNYIRHLATPFSGDKDRKVKKKNGMRFLIEEIKD